MLLRNKEVCKVCRNVSNPVMFKGLPLKLAVASLVITIVLAGVGLQLSNIEGINLYVLAGGIFGGIFFSIRYIKKFFKDYGINGYELQKRDKSLIDTIQADKSIEQILKSKIQ